MHVDREQQHKEEEEEEVQQQQQQQQQQHQKQYDETTCTQEEEADEEDFLQLIVANETVLTWLEKWEMYQDDVPRLAVLLREIAGQVTEKEPYAEEARECGMADWALRTMKKIQGQLEDEVVVEMMDDVSSILAACSGPLAQGNSIKRMCFGHHEIVVKEGALGDGVGAKLWQVARIMCHRMVEDADTMVVGKTVLEVGAGVGACGFLAGFLGATRVVITDYVDTLLRHLKDALALNYPDSVGEDPWSRGHTSVRFLDWEDSLHVCEDTERPPPAALDGESSGTVAPGVPDTDTFDVIIGTDVLYEWPMVYSLSAAIKHRLKEGGRAYICNAVRDQAMFDALVECIESRDLVVQVDQIPPESIHHREDSSTFCRNQDYEGGYVWVEITHPCKGG